MNNAVSMSQVHGSKVVVVGKRDIGKKIKDCDGLITRTKGVSLRVAVADCLPVFIKDLEGDGIGLIHAGWRGLRSGIIKNAVLLMKKEFKTKPVNISVFIGPHICQKHYEVGRDVEKEFNENPEALLKLGRKTFLDLAEVAKNQFLKLRVKKENIQISDECTFESETLYSYRKDHTDKRNIFYF